MKLIKGLFTGVAFAMALFTTCSSNNNSKLTVSGLNPTKFGITLNEKPVRLFVLEDSNDMEVCVINFGAHVVSIYVPNKAGAVTDTVLGYDNIT